MKRRILPILLAICMVVTLMPTVALAGDPSVSATPAATTTTVAKTAATQASAAFTLTNAPVYADR